jgi:probable O-glycosylation ligase (exosortase A-associated)
MSPHQEAFGFSRSLPTNFIISAITILVWLLSAERKALPRQFLFWIMIVFLVWTTITTILAASPSLSYPLWDRTWKIFALGFLVAITATNKARIHALVWVVVASLFYYGVKGGAFTILTGGRFHVLGPISSQIYDNNNLAVALLMALPLANYLRSQSRHRWVRNGILLSMALVVVAVLGSYSRGAFLALGALLIAGWVRMGLKIRYLVAIGIVVVPALYFMPDTFYNRMDTISTFSEDNSVHGRLVAWQVAYNVAVSHFPIGAGFVGPTLFFKQYFPKEVVHAAHSIYFQVLGEHGFVGLAIYLIIIAAAFIKCGRLMRATRDKPEMRWIYDLVMMIQMSLLVFCVGAAALSMAYYDVFVLLLSLLMPLSEAVFPQLAPKTRRIRTNDLKFGQPALPADQ